LEIHLTTTPPPPQREVEEVGSTHAHLIEGALGVDLQPFKGVQRWSHPPPPPFVGWRVVDLHPLFCFVFSFSIFIFMYYIIFFNMIAYVGG
jgi:hypothetical protein